MNDYDTAHIKEIILDTQGVEYDWYNAHVLRFLNIALAKADMDNLVKLYSIWPQQVAAIYRYWGWPESGVFEMISLIQYNTILIGTT